MRPNTERSTLKPQRPPPPVPSAQSELFRISDSPITKSALLETSPSTELTHQTTDNVNKNPSSLLLEFQHLFDYFDYEYIRKQILTREMTECNFTTVLWRIFLHCLPRNSNQWDDMLDTSRCNYEKLIDKYKIDPYKMNQHDYNEVKNNNHPLSRDENSLWAQYFANEDLKATITTDVRRTCPDISFFRNPRMIDLQLRILFTHSRHHQNTIPYRQGMHEILGVVVYALHLENLKIRECEESNEIMKKLHDPQYLEHDAYSIFEKIMDHLRQYYSHTVNPSGTYNKKSNVNGTQQMPFQKSKNIYIPVNDTITTTNSIFERLKLHDRFLHCKLEQLDIEPTVYGIRWLRLLFGREVPFESIPKLWTVIFCFDEHFGFVDYFFIALLMQVGQIISQQEQTEHSDYLQSLMQQNLINDVEPVIRKALNLTGKVTKLPELIANPVVIQKKNESRTIYQSDNKQEYSAQERKELQRVLVPPRTKTRLNRPIITEEQKAAAAVAINYSMDAIKSNSSTLPSNVSSQQSTAKSGVPNSFLDAEMNLWNEKTTRQQYDDNVQLQKRCAQYMNTFIDRLQVNICDLNLPNEVELHIPLSGLKQIASVLEGKLSFDRDSLQALVNYKSQKKIEINSSDINELS